MVQSYHGIIWNNHNEIDYANATHLNIRREKD